METSINNKCKAFTLLEQSKKLAKILPLESADMGWYYPYNPNSARNQMWLGTKSENADIPCWSLAALLGVLPDYTLQTNSDGTVFVVCDSKKPMISDAYDNPVDACYEMVLKLHELNLL